jgi:hypothetical protein
MRPPAKATRNVRATYSEFAVSIPYRRLATGNRTGISHDDVFNAASSEFSPALGADISPPSTSTASRDSRKPFPAGRKWTL